jgi:hypothetical protein
MSTSRRAFAAVAVLSLSFAATPAVAQAWRGVPLDSLNTGVALLAGFPENSDTYGAEAFRNFGAVTAGVEYGLSTFEGDVPSAHTGVLNLALPLALPGLTEAGLAIAPVASPSYTSWDELSIIQVPVGASVAFRVPAGPGLSIVPYAVPQFVWARMSMDVAGTSQSDTDSDFGFRAGGNLVVNNLIFGASYHKIGDGDGTVGINVGFLFQ